MLLNTIYIYILQREGAVAYSQTMIHDIGKYGGADELYKYTDTNRQFENILAGNFTNVVTKFMKRAKKHKLNLEVCIYNRYR